MFVHEERPDFPKIHLTAYPQRTPVFLDTQTTTIKKSAGMESFFIQRGKKWKNVRMAPEPLRAASQEKQSQSFHHSQSYAKKGPTSFGISLASVKSISFIQPFIIFSSVFRPSRNSAEALLSMVGEERTAERQERKYFPRSSKINDEDNATMGRCCTYCRQYDRNVRGPSRGRTSKKRNSSADFGNLFLHQRKRHPSRCSDNGRKSLRLSRTVVEETHLS